ncbi:hypothetical protein LTR17_018262 [Elasticomyces elasticus]|nr:hypothetical protein LTR17_018262 [Elasticomyces elasticus]
MFRPKIGRDTPTDEECHNIVQELLRLKQPDHVVACCGSILVNHWLARFHSTNIEHAPNLVEVDIGAKLVTCVRCFHPGYFVNYVQFDPKARLIFVLGMMLGFTYETRDQNAIAKVAEFVRPTWQPPDSSLSPVDAALRLLPLLRQIHSRIGRVPEVEKDAHENGCLFIGAEEEIFDLLWTLPAVTNTDATLQIMEACLLWPRFCGSSFLHQVLIVEMIDLVHKQRPFENVVDQLGRVTLSSHVPRLTVWKKLRLYGYPDMPRLWREGIEIQSQNVVTITQKFDGLRQPAGCDPNAQMERKKHASTVANKCATELQSTLALMCAATVWLEAGEGVFQGEEQLQWASVDAFDVKKSIHQILETLLAAKQLIISTLKKVVDTEEMCGAFRLCPTDDCQSPRRLSDFIKSSEEFDESSKVPAILMAIRVELAGLPGLFAERKETPAEVRYFCRQALPSTLTELLAI